MSMKDVLRGAGSVSSDIVERPGVIISRVTAHIRYHAEKIEASEAAGDPLCETLCPICDRLEQACDVEAARPLSIGVQSVPICHGTDLRANVAAFHAATGIKDPDRPCVPADEVVRLRARMLVEELFETLRAMIDVAPSSYVPSRFVEAERTLVDLINRSMIRVSLPDYADGLADLMYIAEGGFLAFGIDSRPVHAEVQRANMAKVGGPIREDGKRLKPPGWTPPDIAGVIQRQIDDGSPIVRYTGTIHHQFSAPLDIGNISNTTVIGDCAFCGRKSTPIRQIVCLGVPALVCTDPVRQTDKPMPPNCAWRYCARTTNGAHNPDEAGSCKNCGKPAIAPK